MFLGEIEKQKRKPDGLLHASSDLSGSLRHVQLRIADAPTRKRSAASQIRLMHGTLWHEWWHSVLISKGVPFFHELSLKGYMPEGWTGTADWVFWHPEYEAFILGDLKTAKGEALYWINQRGAKEDHLWQLSAYYYACLNMGLPMVKGMGVMYWPMNDVEGEDPQPVLMECEPLADDIVLGRMTERWDAVQNFRFHGEEMWESAIDELAPEQDREQKLVWNKLQEGFDVKLVPNWSTRFCDWEPPYCSCSLQGTTKIGQYDLEGAYTARSGYEETEPTIKPTERELNVRKIRRA